MALRERFAWPKDSLSEDIYFNQELFDKYADIVLQCSKMYELTMSSGIKAEGPSMISKMRGLLSLSVKCDVDYEEALNDVCNVLVHLRKGEAAGKRASNTATTTTTTQSSITSVVKSPPKLDRQSKLQKKMVVALMRQLLVPIVFMMLR